MSSPASFKGHPFHPMIIPLPIGLSIFSTIGGGSMKKVKSMIGFIFLVGVCVTSLWAEYNLAVRFAIMLSVASVAGLLALLGALLGAPEGNENENGFHIRARRKQARRPRHVLAEDKPASHKGIFTATISNFRERKFAWLEREKSTL